MKPTTIDSRPIALCPSAMSFAGHPRHVFNVFEVAPSASTLKAHPLASAEIAGARQSTVDGVEFHRLSMTGFLACVRCCIALQHAVHR